jgi:Uma2 family endonuclease
MSTATLEPTITKEPDFLYEVVDGQLVEKPVGRKESILAVTLHDFLSPFVKANGLGRSFIETTFWLPPKNNERRPDVSFVSTVRLPADIDDLDDDTPLVPDLAVEVVSPSNQYDDIDEKIEEYFAAGVLEVWVVSRRFRHIMIHESNGQVRKWIATETLTSKVLPGFQLHLSKLFPQKPN